MINLCNLAQRFRSGLAQNTLLMLVGYGARLLFQLTAFVLLARTLGVQEFGILAAGVALITLITPFVELGAYNLIISDVARGSAIRNTVGSSLLLTVINVPLGLLLIGVIGSLFLSNVPMNILIPLGLADFLGTRLVTIVNGAFVAKQQLWRSAVLEIFLGLMRLLFVTFLIVLGGGIQQWAWLSFVANFLSATLLLTWLTRLFGRPIFSWAEAISKLKPGLHFAAGSASQNAYTDLDKAMLSRLDSAIAVGIYTAAFRFITVAYLPLNAFLASTYLKFFEAGRHSFGTAYRLALKVLPVTSAYGLFASAILWLSAPLLPYFLGSEYKESTHALRLLCLIPVAQSFYFPFGDALTGTGHQALRSTLQTVALILNVCLNFLLIPSYGWIGAGWASLISQYSLALSVALSVLYLNRRYL